jgi:hypothetical protein
MCTSRIQLTAPAEQAPLTFEQLCELEPRLLDLLNEARAIKDNRRKRSFCANQVWYGWRGHEGFKPRLLDLVGFRRKHDGSDPRLATSRAYDVAYHTIYDALPDCRNCACVALWETEIAPRLAECKR